MTKMLITGASRGIGRACAERFARAGGYAISALARHEDALHALQRDYPASITPLVLDLTAPFTLSHAYDIVVLNAGTYTPGGLLDPQRDVFTELLALNVLANHRIARQLLPALRSRDHGHLIVIGSVATDDTPEHMTAYATTKKALRALFEGWEQELAGSGVRTTLIAPGATLTSSWDDEAPPPRILQPDQVAELVQRAVTEGLTGRWVLRAED